MRKNYGYYGYGKDPEGHYSGNYYIADVDAQILEREGMGTK